MATKNPSRNEQQIADQALIDGLTKHATSVPTLMIGGTTVQTADVIRTLQARILARKAPLTSRATWQSDVKADQEQRASTKTLVSGVRQALQVAFAGSIEVLADFGLKPRKTRVVTPEVQTAAAAKAKATRAARHTMGPKAKAKIKGVVPEATPETAPSPATTATPAAPSPTTAVRTS